jgi:pimeloyl-ACP methyl ester carboxylesterase
MNIIQTRGIELEYEEKGSGEPVLLIGPVLADGLRPLMSDPALLERYRLIHYHKRGWRRSTPSAGPVSIAEHAADAAGLLEALGVRRAHVAGHSSGGAVALQLAVDRPALVQSLILLEPTMLGLPAGAAFLDHAAPAFELHRTGDDPAAIASFLALASGLPWPACQAVLERTAPGAVRHAIAEADAFFEVELAGLAAWRFSRDQAAAIDRPALSVTGGDSGPLFEQGAELLRAMPRVEEVQIDGVGHLLQLQKPEPVTRAVAGFLARHGAR